MVFGTHCEEVAHKREFLKFITGNQPPKHVFVKGPPGTGKTEFLLAAAFELMMRQGHRVLFLAPPGAYEHVKDQLEKQRKWENFPNFWKSDEAIGFSWDDLSNHLKRLVIVQFPPLRSFTTAGFEVVILDHLNTINALFVRSLCQNPFVRIIGAYDETIHQNVVSPIDFLKSGQPPLFFTEEFIYSSRPEEITHWISQFCWLGTQGSKNSRVELAFIDTTTEVETIIEKIKELLEQGTPAEQIGVSGITKLHVDTLRLALHQFPGVRVETLDVWSTSTIGTFMLALSSDSGAVPSVMELNVALTRARSSLIVFGSQAGADRAAQDLPYFKEFLRIIKSQKPVVEKVWEPICIPDGIWDHLLAVQKVDEPAVEVLEEPEELYFQPISEGDSEGEKLIVEVPKLIEQLEEPEHLEPADSEVQEPAPELHELSISTKHVVPAPDAVPEEAPRSSPPEDPTPAAAPESQSYYKISFPPGFKPPPGFRF